MSIFRLLNFLFLYPRKAFFGLEYRKRHFPGLYCIKKKVGKMSICGPKRWVNRFAKMSIFQLFERFVFIAQKSVFSLQNTRKKFLWPILPKKKSSKKCHFWTKRMGKAFGKMSIFRPCELLFFIAQKGVFSFQNIVKDISLDYIA